MPEFDLIDQRLIAALTRDGRASVTTLASLLGVARATVQTRIEKLVTSRVIRRFTVDVDSSVATNVIRAVMLIKVTGTVSRSVARSLNTMPEIISLHTTNGSWDLVAQVEVSSLPEFDQVLTAVREVEGVSNSETCLLLDTARG